MNVREMLIQSLDDAKLEIYLAADVDAVEDILRKAMADIYGGLKSGILPDGLADQWKEEIQKVATFRRASLEWREET